jgi:hypothetical protein
MQFKISYQFLGLAAVASFACFVVSTLLALSEISKASDT